MRLLTGDRLRQMFAAAPDSASRPVRERLAVAVSNQRPVRSAGEVLPCRPDITTAVIFVQRAESSNGDLHP